LRDYVTKKKMIRKTPAPTPTDPFRSIIWSIGNGSSEHQLCTTLEDGYHIFCPLANILDEQICIDYRSAYKARCKDPHLAAEGTFIYLACVLILCLSIASFIKTKKLVFIPDSAITIGVGWATGLLMLASKQGGGRRFDEQIFFDMLLPFILFEAGYNMDRKLLRKKLSLIFTLATLGTLISFFVTLGLIVASVKLINSNMSLLDCSIFAALISSTDPVAVVAVFSSMGVNPDLFIVIFGESTFNDCVSVALYGSFKYFYSHPEIHDGEAISTIVSNFIYVALGSLMLGFLCGLGTAYLWKRIGKRWFTHPVLETLLFLLFALIPYYTADALHWSGVVAIISTSITLSIYAHPNLSKTASFHVVFLVECLSRLFEACIFGYLGTQMIVNNEKLVWSPLVPLGALSVLLARFVATIPLISFHNCFLSDNKMSMKHQLVVWFSGLRGALAFALAVTIPEYDSVTRQGSHYAGDILATTSFIIVWMVFVMAPLTPFVVKWAGVIGSSSAQHQHTSSPSLLVPTTGDDNDDEQHYHEPTTLLDRTEHSDTVDDKSRLIQNLCSCSSFGQFVDYLHVKYLRPIFIASSSSLRDEQQTMMPRQEIETSPGSSAIFVRELPDEDGGYAVVHLNNLMDDTTSTTMDVSSFPRSTVVLLRSVSEMMLSPGQQHQHQPSNNNISIGGQTSTHNIPSNTLTESLLGGNHGDN
jgi:sodium/hydrogen exchanger 3